MNRSEAQSIVEASFSRPIATPNTSQLPREEFIELEKAKLLQSLIEPFEVISYAGTWAIEHCGFEEKEYRMIAIANEGTTWLLYEPASQHFYKAWRTEGSSSKLFLLGFHSDDALTEWRG